jgi:hypothetical protein
MFGPLIYHFRSAGNNAASRVAGVRWLEGFRDRICAFAGCGTLLADGSMRKVGFHVLDFRPELRSASLDSKTCRYPVLLTL